jgi:hypothetical protein
MFFENVQRFADDVYSRDAPCLETLLTLKAKTSLIWIHGGQGIHIKTTVNFVLKTLIRNKG